MSKRQDITNKSQKYFTDLLSPSKSQKNKWLYRFFWWCAGADQDLLSKCETDHEKYLGIGLTIFLTAVLATISGSFAIGTLVSETQYVVAMGLFWGFIIFNLDRFVVLSITKENNIGKELLAAVPRFILAIIIAIVISTPIEIALFKTQIDYQIETDALKRKNDIVLKNVQVHNLAGLQTNKEQMESTIAELDSLKYTEPTSTEYLQLKANYEAAKKAHKKVSNELEPKIRKNRSEISNIKSNSSYKHTVEKRIPNPRGDGSVLIVDEVEIQPEWQNRIAVLEAENGRYKKQIAEKAETLNSLTQQVNSERRKFEVNMEQQIAKGREEASKVQAEIAKRDSIKNIDVERGIKASEMYSQGFFSRLEALHNLGVNDDGTKNSMYWARWMIWLLFVVIETAPIFVKLVVKQGAYDIALARKAEHEVIKIEQSLKRNRSL